MKTSQCLSWLGMLFIVAVMACTTTDPPQELVVRQDHAGLDHWYQAEAARLRARAEVMRVMAEAYTDPSYPLSPKETREELITHCERFIAFYTKAAEEAETLATLHRKQGKTIP